MTLTHLLQLTYIKSLLCMYYAFVFVLSFTALQPKHSEEARPQDRQECSLLLRCYRVPRPLSVHLVHVSQAPPGGGARRL